MGSYCEDYHQSAATYKQPPIVLKTPVHRVTKPIQLKQAKSEIKMKVEKPCLDNMESPIHNNNQITVDLSSLNLQKQQRGNYFQDYKSREGVKVSMTGFKLLQNGVNLKEVALNVHNFKQIYSDSAQQIYEDSEQRLANSITSSQISRNKKVYSRFNQPIGVNYSNQHTGRSSI
jgi:hypothetical protein